ncbi:hypothetical protein GNI_152740 [Gregarina niphandrodes]|uniref:Uncharacterized protein n=1 Tax=Gregarina niphandrodes TaxID=110365 RepID=A0A023AZC6_GRENI|nr:hypothetical protein GNI_152740 [Gregarina niphandrodes]EZG44077.1 hypothetical protein GNI_152740 [Gregarina niphandrodes]|eukprot:XP_011132820.1 hypothetical protein GNI_152740 [Gregarina niphandrodes]
MLSSVARRGGRRADSKVQAVLGSLFAVAEGAVVRVDCSEPAVFRAEVELSASHVTLLFAVPVGNLPVDDLTTELGSQLRDSFWIAREAFRFQLDDDVPLAAGAVAEAGQLAERIIFENLSLLDVRAAGVATQQLTDVAREFFAPHLQDPLVQAWLRGFDARLRRQGFRQDPHCTGSADSLGTSLGDVRAERELVQPPLQQPIQQPPIQQPVVVQHPPFQRQMLSQRESLRDRPRMYVDMNAWEEALVLERDPRGYNDFSFEEVEEGVPVWVTEQITEPIFMAEEERGEYDQGKEEVADKRAEEKRAEEKRAEEKRAVEERAEEKRAEEKRAEEKRESERESQRETVLKEKNEEDDSSPLLRRRDGLAGRQSRVAGSLSRHSQSSFDLSNLHLEWEHGEHEIVGDGSDEYGDTYLEGEEYVEEEEEEFVEEEELESDEYSETGSGDNSESYSGSESQISSSKRELSGTVKYLTLMLAEWSELSQRRMVNNLGEPLLELQRLLSRAEALDVKAELLEHRGTLWATASAEARQAEAQDRRDAEQQVTAARQILVTRVGELHRHVLQLIADRKAPLFRVQHVQLVERFPPPTPQPN